MSKTVKLEELNETSAFISFRWVKRCSSCMVKKQHKMHLSWTDFALEEDQRTRSVMIVPKKYPLKFHQWQLGEHTSDTK